MNLWESRIHKRRPALHKRRGFPLRTKERRAMPMYVTYSDLIQIGIFIVALVGLCYTIFGKRKWGCRTNVRQLISYFQHKTPSFEKPGVRGIISLCD